MDNDNTFTLVDDGTLDTVIKCDNCSQEIRFTGGEVDLNMRHDEWVDYCMAMAKEEHECS